jgi:drug/metabolite transporter (DMT)-like permease
LGLGAAAGAFGAIGLALLYQALATHQMALVASAAAVVSAVVPVIAGVLTGERPDAIAWVGAVLGVIAILLVTLSSGDVDTVDWRGVGLGAASGVAFGLFFILIVAAEDEAGTWPLVGARAASWRSSPSWCSVASPSRDLPGCPRSAPERWTWAPTSPSSTPPAGPSSSSWP